MDQIKPTSIANVVGCYALCTYRVSRPTPSKAGRLVTRCSKHDKCTGRCSTSDSCLRSDSCHRWCLSRHPRSWADPSYIGLSRDTTKSTTSVKNLALQQILYIRYVNNVCVCVCINVVLDLSIGLPTFKCSKGDVETNGDFTTVSWRHFTFNVYLRCIPTEHTLVLSTSAETRQNVRIKWWWLHIRGCTRTCEPCRSVRMYCVVLYF